MDKINRADLLKNPVKDTIVNKDTTLKKLMDMFQLSGGFTAKKIFEGYEILKEEFTSDETTFLSFPADIISTGTRGVINELVKNKLVDVIITTNGTLDHDIARTYTDYYSGTFNFGDTKLRDMNINRLGNVFVPDESYGIVIENRVMPFIEELYKIKKEWAPVDLIKEIGLKLNNDDSILYNAAKNDIPVFVPGITDGSFGSQLWSFYEMNHDFKINILEDEHRLSDIIFDAKKTGALMIGGGISKHHTIWWNQFRDGLDEAVYITTAQEFDGSLSGAKLEEAITWKKVKENAKFANIYGDATVILPLIVAPFL
ncbi:MAG: deoxyhypusine synthase [Ferroplasma sp.]